MPSSQSSDSRFVNNMATLGHIKATISFATSIIMSIVLIIIGIVTFIKQKNAIIRAQIITINTCNNNTCNVIVSYKKNGKTITKNVNTNVDIRVGDIINVHDDNTHAYMSLTIFIGVALLLCICGSVIYKIIMSNKYIAAESAMSQPIIYT
jgi:hypothetical protein